MAETLTKCQAHFSEWQGGLKLSHRWSTELSCEAGCWLKGCGRLEGVAGRAGVSILQIDSFEEIGEASLNVIIEGFIVSVDVIVKGYVLQLLLVLLIDMEVFVSEAIELVVTYTQGIHTCVMKLLKRYWAERSSSWRNTSVL